ncbi:MAG: acetyltransferase [Leptospiraceae bacterium]|nr:acetyltransferase [Leptospiraceae bacterium]
METINTPIFIVGAGGHAWSCMDLLLTVRNFEILGFIASESEKGNKIMGYSVVGSDSDLPKFRSISPYAINAIGQIKSFEPRRRIFNLLKSLDFYLPSIISPTAYFSPFAELGEGTMIFPKVFVNAGVNIGQNCIINSGAIIEHNVQIGRHSHISTGVILNGGVEIGEGCFLGSGTIVQENSIIPDFSVIPMGSIVNKKGVIRNK